MKITQFIRERSDVELARLMTSGLKWNWLDGMRLPDQAVTEKAGCLLCNTFDIRSHCEYVARHNQFVDVENWYCYATSRREYPEVGGLVARLATREMGRRAVAAIGSLPLPESAREAVAR